MNVFSFDEITQNVIDEFTSNTKQELTFRTVIGNAVKGLHGENTEQLLLLMCGSGGTGKRRVIQSIVQHHTCLNIQPTIHITAFTGTTTANINGSTIHSLAQLNSHNVKKETLDLESLWSRVNNLIVDVFSMVGCQMFAKLNERLVIVKNSPSDKPFGEINMKSR